MVRQFQVYRHPQVSRRAQFPYLFVLQHDTVPAFSGEVIVAPLAPCDQSTSTRMQPVLDIEGRSFKLLTPAMGRVPVHRLTALVTCLERDNVRIIKALDMLFVGS